MARGALYGTLGGVAGLCCTQLGFVVLLGAPWFVLLTWPWVFVIAGPLLAIAALPLGRTQQAVRPRLTPWLFKPVAILLGMPFGVAVCFLILKFFGKEGNPWTSLDWLPWMPAALGAGLGLGWGGLLGSTAHE